MNPELMEELGRYFIQIDESNQSIYVSWTISNDVIGTDGEYQYYGYTSTFFNGQKVNNLVSVGTVGGGGGPGIDSVGDDPITLNSNPSASPNDDTPATTYSFALDGRRVAKAGAVDVKYLYDGDNVIYELWDDKTVRFTHPISKSGGGGCGASNNGIFFTDHPISISIDGVKYYYLYDGLGSVTELIDENENVVNTYRYTPFGESLVREETVYNPYQFTGRRYDAESGLYYYRARAYSPDIGRFMQVDPAGMVDGANMYAYVGNNPVNRVDPSGNQLHWGIRVFDVWKAHFRYMKGIIESCNAECVEICKCSNIPNEFADIPCNFMDVMDVKKLYGVNVKRDCLWDCKKDCLGIRLSFTGHSYVIRPHSGPAYATF